MRRLAAALATMLTAATLLVPAVGHAEFPERPVRIVVPFPAGGGMDAVSRVVAKDLSDSLGQSVIVENRPGGNGVVGILAMVNSEPDGYTVLTQALGLAINPSIYQTLPYDGNAIQPVTILGFSPVYLAVNPKLPVHSLREFVELARKQRLRAAVFGLGAGRMMAEALRLEGGFDVDMVPYKGAAPAITGTMAGETDFVMMDAPSVQQYITSGRLRGLAVASEKRSPTLPELPTMGEAGLPGVVVDFWYAMFTRPDVPLDVRQTLNTEINRVIQSPEVAERMKAMGIIPNPMSLDDAHRFYQSEVKRWGAVVKAAGVQPIGN
jgi:tripartite-type tricarboxylate transporter receptor subunit TctC